MFTKQFWLDACERAVKTFAQFLLVSGAFDVASTDLETALPTKLIGAGLAAVTSLLMSIGSVGFGPANNASLVSVATTDEGH